MIKYPTFVGAPTKKWANPKKIFVELVSNSKTRKKNEEAK
jgi:hypothetical protein